MIFIEADERFTVALSDGSHGFVIAKNAKTNETGTICDISWETDDCKVICREIGMRYTYNYIYIYRYACLYLYLHVYLDMDNYKYLPI